MQQVTSSLDSLPSFSVVIETENLATAALAGLARSLESLANQTLPLTAAKDVLMIDSGNTPPALLDQLSRQYPWLKVHPAPPGTGYYKAKMLGAVLATGQVVVYGDSDCLYEPDWLRCLLIPFTQESIQIVAGETITRGVDPYGTAMALTYIFPQYSDDRALTPTAQYFLNNVAFRRECLLQQPIPDQLPLYRGNCVIHAHTLQQQGYTIWRQPQARATHAPPSSLSHFFWRFLLIGHDYYWQKQLLAQTGSEAGGAINPRSTADNRDPIAGLSGKLAIFGERVTKMVRHDRRHLLYLPFALPIVLTAALLIFIGYRITSFKPDLLLEAYDRSL